MTPQPWLTVRVSVDDGTTVRPLPQISPETAALREALRLCVRRYRQRQAEAQEREP